MNFSFKSAGQFAMFCIHRSCSSCVFDKACRNIPLSFNPPGSEKHYSLLVKHFRKQKLEKLLSCD